MKTLGAVSQLIDAEPESKQTIKAQSLCEVKVPLYNRTYGNWETVDQNGLAGANELIDLYAYVNGLSDYKDGSNFISCRVGQEL